MKKLQTIEEILKDDIFERIGAAGLFETVACSGPLKKLAFLPYNLAMFYFMFKKSKSIADLDARHYAKDRESAIFRALHPSYRRMRRILLEQYEIL